MRLAFDLLNHPLDGVQLIEASAGTGKTWTLCALYLRLLLEKKLDVGRILVVTFTRAAAAELRERIRARIHDLAHAIAHSENSEDPLARRWLADGAPQCQQAQLRLERALYHFDQAAIYTIHGFCQRALLDAPFASAHPPEFEIQEDDETLRLECAMTFWRAQVDPAAAADAGFTAWLIQHHAQPAALAALLARRSRKPLARLICGEKTARIGDNAGFEASALPPLFESARALWRAEREGIAHRLQRALPGLRKNVYRTDSIEAAFDAWNHYFDLERFAVDVPCVASRAPDSKAQLLCATRLKQSLNKGGCAPEHAFFTCADRLLEAHAGIERAHRLKWQSLARDWLDWGARALLELKRSRCIASYQDLLTHLARALNTQPALARVLQARYGAALIDEFQDTDPLQFDIFQRIFAPRGPLFLVGDPKQAIYSFRAADLHTYLRARRAASGHATLAVNQRACAALIDACNRIFSVHRNAFILNGLHYAPVAANGRERPPFHCPSARAADLKPCRVWMLPDGNSLINKDAERRSAARACAEEIVRLLESARIGATKLAPGDIAVLVQTRAQGSVMKHILSEWGIGSVELAQTSIFETEDAEAFERVLHAIAAPHDTACLRAALVTDWFEADAHALAQSRRGNALSSDMSHWAESFIRYRTLWQRRGFAALWRILLHEQRIAQRLAAQPFGERRLTNLNHLAEQIQTYAAHALSIAATLRWFSVQRAAQRTGPAPEELRLRLESDRALVRIATVHIAKGLEYAVVFCPFLGDGDLRVASFGGLHHAHEYHDEDGHAVFHYAPGEDEKERASQRDYTVRIEQAAERARLIYVALTRAVYHCTLVAGPYTSGSTPSVKQSCSSVLNWLVAGAGRDFADWFAKPPQPEEIAACWQRLAGESLAVEPLPMATAPSQHCSRASSGLANTTAWRARAAQCYLQEDWRIASFTALTTPPPDRILSAATSDAVISASKPFSEDNILRFPRGAYAGQCLHRLFEYADLSTPCDWPAAIERTLREYPELARRNDDDRLSAMMMAMLNDVAASELIPGLRLNAVESACQLSELEFIFPVASLDLSALRALLGSYGYPELSLTAETLAGYLCGAIDRVFQHAGRFWIIDWKSNDLGGTAACYAPAQLGAEIAAHAYHLQTLLYTLAVHRYLRLHVPNYNYARHFGGAFTLFVRGIRPAWRARGRCAGVHLDTPAPALMEALDRLMSG